NDLLGKTDITNYIRHFWNARNYPAERKVTLFKTIKRKIETYELSIDLINSLDESAFIYSSLNNPDSEVWMSEQSKYINEINILEVTQCYPLLMMGKQKFSETEFTKLLRDVVNLSFRYNTIGGQNPNELERVYGRASVAIYKEEIKDARNLFLTYLKDIYIEDDSFRNDFKNKQINTNKYNTLVKYILSKLEIQYGGVEPILTNKNLTIEHILPENPNDEWALEFKNVDIGDYIFRIGNLTFLESGKNKEADRKSFEEKQKIYLTSNFKLTKEQIEYSVWNVTSLASRQADMANKAATVWKINYQ
ncbi:MAG TPA: HNH endonuclease family protein, partial [Leptospiraceae bacterium]|nr:HNH endonuclease family protein [Leptospiraceae bacterium]